MYKSFFTKYSKDIENKCQYFPKVELSKESLRLETKNKDEDPNEDVNKLLYLFNISCEMIDCINEKAISNIGIDNEFLKAFTCHLMQAVTSYSNKLCSVMGSFSNNVSKSSSNEDKSLPIIKITKEILNIMIKIICNSKVFEFLRKILSLDQLTKLLCPIIEASFNITFEYEMIPQNKELTIDLVYKLRSGAFHLVMKDKKSFNLVKVLDMVNHQLLTFIQLQKLFENSSLVLSLSEIIIANTLSITFDLMEVQKSFMVLANLQIYAETIFNNTYFLSHWKNMNNLIINIGEKTKVTDDHTNLKLMTTMSHIFSYQDKIFAINKEFNQIQNIIKISEYFIEKSSSIDIILISSQLLIRAILEFKSNNDSFVVFDDKLLRLSTSFKSNVLKLIIQRSQINNGKLLSKKDVMENSKEVIVFYKGLLSNLQTIKVIVSCGNSADKIEIDNASLYFIVTSFLHLFNEEFVVSDSYPLLSHFSQLTAIVKLVGAILTSSPQILNTAEKCVSLINPFNKLLSIIFTTNDVESMIDQVVTLSSFAILIVSKILNFINSQINYELISCNTIIDLLLDCATLVERIKVKKETLSSNKEKLYSLLANYLLQLILSKKEMLVDSDQLIRNSLQTKMLLLSNEFLHVFNKEFAIKIDSMMESKNLDESIILIEKISPFIFQQRFLKVTDFDTYYNSYLEYLKSQLLWNSKESHSEKFQHTIERLLDIIIDIDKENMQLLPNNLLINKLKKNKKFKKSDIKIDSGEASDSEQLIKLVSSYRVWFSLCMWSSQIVLNNPFNNPEDSAIYMTNTIKCIKLIATHLNKYIASYQDSSDKIIQIVCDTFCFSFRKLFNMMYIHGRISDQLTIVKVLCGLSTHIKIFSDLYMTCTELIILSLFQLFNIGIAVSDDDYINSCLKYLQVFYGSKIISAFYLKLALFIYDSIDQLNPGVLKSNGTTETLIAELNLDKTSTFNSNQLLNYVDNLLSNLIVLKSSSNSYLIIIIQINIYLVSSKLLSYKHFDLFRSFKSIRKGLSHVLMISGKTNIEDSEAVKNRATDLRFLSLKIDCLLFIAELYEQSGNIDSSLSYISDAVTLAKYCEFGSLSNIVALHSIRIWYRLSSPRVTTIAQDILSINDFSRVEVNDEMSKNIRRIVQCISLPLNIITERNDSIKDWDMMYNFRYIFKTWDIDSLTNNIDLLEHINTSDDGNYIQVNLLTRLGIFLCSVPPEMKKNMSILSEQRVKNNDEVFIYNNSRKFKPNDFQLNVLNELINSNSFDLRRFSQRRKVIECLQSNIITDSFSVFLNGASSCNISIVCDLSKATKIQESLEKNIELSHLEKSVSLIDKALKGDSTSCDFIRNELRSMISNAFRKDISAIICCVCLEHSTNSLIIGRMDNSTEAIISLPIGNEVNTIIEEWNLLMENGKASLSQSADVISKWTEIDKKKWWNERKEFDDNIFSILGKLEELLGPWKQLFRNTNSYSSSITFSSKEFLTVGEIQSLKKIASMDEFERFMILWIRLLISDQDNNNQSDNDKVLKALVTVLGNITAGVINQTRLAEIADKIIFTSKNNDLTDCDTQTTTNTFSLNNNNNESLYNEMKVTDIRNKLKEFSLSTQGKKNELITRLLEYDTLVNKTLVNNDNNSSMKKTCDDSHVILILDEQLQQIPWECLSFLVNKSSSRVPSISILLSTALKYSSLKDVNNNKTDVPKGKSKTIKKERDDNDNLKLDISKCWYAVDIEGNLPGTRELMGNFLNKFSSLYNWKGVVAEIPNENIIREFHEKSDLFIYCGHGSGEKMCDSHKFKKYVNCPSALLWGCSSGKLRTLGCHDPVGPAIHYLQGGSDFVLGNLWDVTDKDIDKLSIHCMESLLVIDNNDSGSENKSNNICKCLKDSRSVCKMKYAVGYAPVVYGIPISFDSI